MKTHDCCVITTGAVFNLLCGDQEIKRMDKIQKHFGSEVIEVRFLL